MKTYGESNLMGLPKKELIEYIRCCLAELDAVELIRCRDCRFNDPTERDKAVEWLPCMSADKPSSWFCGSAERRNDGRS